MLLVKVDFSNKIGIRNAHLETTASAFITHTDAAESAVCYGH